VKIARFTRLAATRLCCSNCRGYRLDKSGGVSCAPLTCHSNPRRGVAPHAALWSPELPRMIATRLTVLLHTRSSSPVQISFQRTSRKVVNLHKIATFLRSCVELVIKSTQWDGGLRILFLQECQQCHKPYYAPKHSPGKFCNYKCYLDNKAANAKKLSFTCAQCGISFTRRWDSKPKSGLYFCSRICKEKAQSLTGIPGFQLPHYGQGESNYRAIAFRHYDKKCNRCSYSEIPEILQVHHKDRDQSHNHYSNLEVLCPNCHYGEHFLAKDGWWTSGDLNSTVILGASEMTTPSSPEAHL